MRPTALRAILRLLLLRHSLLLLLLLSAVPVRVRASATAEELASARSLWRSRGSVDYAFRYERTCECAAAVSRPKAVLVRDGEVASVAFADEDIGMGAIPWADSEAVPQHVARDVPTVEGLFDRIGSALGAAAADDVAAEFDAELGYPRVVRVDYDADVADDEHVARLSGLVPAAGPAYDAREALRDGALRDELVRARSAWEACGVDGYDFLYTRACFCRPWYTQRMKVEVRNGAVAGLEYAEYDDGTYFGDAVPGDLAVPTVARLFDVVEEAIDKVGAVVEVAFDGGMHYPTSVYIDGNTRVTDDEVRHEVSDLVAVDLPACAATVAPLNPTAESSKEPTVAPAPMDTEAQTFRSATITPVPKALLRLVQAGITTCVMI